MRPVEISLHEVIRPTLSIVTRHLGVMWVVQEVPPKCLRYKYPYSSLNKCNVDNQSVLSVVYSGISWRTFSAACLQKVLVARCCKSSCSVETAPLLPALFSQRVGLSPVCRLHPGKSLRLWQGTLWDYFPALSQVSQLVSGFRWVFELPQWLSDERVRLQHGVWYQRDGQHQNQTRVPVAASLSNSRSLLRE